MSTDTQPLPDETASLREQIPPLILDGLRRYVTDQEPTGGFLHAVLTNNLMKAVGRAEAASLAALPAIVSFVYWVIPSECHGSPEAVKAWLARREHHDLET